MANQPWWLDEVVYQPGLFIKTNKKPLKQQVNTVSAGFALSPVG
ncbi:hypothetical protein [Weissella confusa]|nr:hypothetical protein [Weissella confusa]